MIRLCSPISDASHDSKQVSLGGADIVPASGAIDLPCADRMSAPPGGCVPRRHAAIGTNRAFTIVELLVVVAIIIVLLGILVVAMNAAARSGQRTRTIALMGSMKQALTRFKEDVGYYPPVLGVTYTMSGPVAGGPAPADLRRLFPNSVPSPTPGVYTGGNYIDHMQEYYSTCTLADYLIGYGSHIDDGYGRVPGASGAAAWEKEIPPLGIRHPGPDGVWGASQQSGALNQRMKWQTNTATFIYGTTDNPFPIDQGKVLGPYLDLKDERLLAGVDYGPNGLQTYFQGDPLPAGLTWDTIPKAIVDYWGQPIRYYRRPYPPGALGQSYRSMFDSATGLMSPVPTLADVFVLRPWDLPPGADVTGVADANGDTGTTDQLNSAEFALFSFGPDKRSDDDVRRDDRPGGDHSNRFNADNIVEVGP